MIKAVIFDIDGVLIDSFEANLKFYQNLIGKARHKPPTKEEFEPIHHLSMLDLIKIFTKNLSDKEIKNIWEMGQGGKVKYPYDSLTSPKDMEATIKDLSKSYTLGIVTSRIKESAEKVLRIIKLNKYFKTIVGYQHTTNHKPHPEPLLLAAKRLGIKPDESIYIVDVENDIKAGKAAGMKVILYSKEQFRTADARTTSFEKLPEIIKSL
jgi:HAD superfamily hydrolase (TIGR01509 family)